MQKCLTKSILFVGIFFSYFAMADYLDSGGVWHTGTTGYQQSGGNMGAFTPPPVASTQSVTISPAAAIVKACADEKGKIENKFGECKYNTSVDNLREVGRCNTLSNTSITIEAGVNYKLVFGGASYTIENPTYDKCINLVTALTSNGYEACSLKYTTSSSTARSANNAQCSDFYK